MGKCENGAENWRENVKSCLFCIGDYVKYAIFAIELNDLGYG